jgi:uncharacterized protein
VIPSYIRPVAGGVEVWLAIRPRATRTRIVGSYGDRLKVQVAAPPVDGKANEELCSFLADRFGLPKTRISVSVGEKSNHKVVRVQGIESEMAAQRLEAPA